MTGVSATKEFYNVTEGRQRTKHKVSMTFPYVLKSFIGHLDS